MRHTQPDDLQEVCQAYPEMEGLVIKYVEVQKVPMSLSPLQNCSQLLYLRMEHQQQYECWGEGLDLSLLPESLRTLELVDAAVDPSTLSRLHLPLLSKLCITDLSLSLDNIELLLQRLPNMQVSHPEHII